MDMEYAVAELDRRLSSLEDVLRSITGKSFGVPILEQEDPDVAALEQKLTSTEGALDAYAREVEHLQDAVAQTVGPRTREGNAKELTLPVVKVAAGPSGGEERYKWVAGEVKIPLPCCGELGQRRRVMAEAIAVALRDLHTQLTEEYRRLTGGDRV